MTARAPRVTDFFIQGALDDRPDVSTVPEGCLFSCDDGIIYKSDGTDWSPWASALDGADGAPGADGTDGADGADGAPGATGADGAQGPAGADGPAGIQGPSGADGPAGATGPAGADGADGATGPAGPQGDPGPPGTILVEHGATTVPDPTHTAVGTIVFEKAS